MELYPHVLSCGKGSLFRTSPEAAQGCFLVNSLGAIPGPDQKKGDVR
jgi:hypothetical protein